MQLSTFIYYKILMVRMFRIRYQKYRHNHKHKEIIIFRVIRYFFTLSKY